MRSSVEIREVRLEDRKCVGLWSLQSVVAGKGGGDCRRCSRFLPGFQLSVVELRFGRDVRRAVGIDGEDIKVYL